MTAVRGKRGGDRGTHGAQRRRVWCRCDSATLNLPRVGRYQVHCPTLLHPIHLRRRHLPHLILPLSLSLCARSSSSRYLVSSDPKERGGGEGESTIKPQDAFREDPVTRALALSSALTKSATEREETRPLRESAPRRRVAAWYYPRIDTLISCHPVSVLVPDGLLNIFLPLSRAHLRWFSPQFHGNEIHALRLRFFPRRKFFSIPQLRGGLFFSLPLSPPVYRGNIYGEYVNTAVFVSLI